MGPRLKNFYQTLAKFPKIALDSSCFIYHIEENQKYLELTKVIFEEFLSNGGIQAIGSTLIITEVLTKAYRHSRQELALDKDLILGLPNFSIFSPEEQICDDDAIIRAKYNFRTPDAIHIGTAIEGNASAIVGNDRRWKQIKEIKSISLEDFV